MNICIVGQGYVGLPIAIESAKSGNTVFGYDIDLKKIESLKNGSSLLPESTKLEIESLQDQGKLIFISDLLQAININIYIIAVPTPLDDLKEPDLSFLKNACNDIAPNLQDNTLVINESTSYIGTLRNLISPIIESQSNAKNLKFAIAPERIDPGNTSWNVKNTPRIVSGLSETAISEAVVFYSQFCDHVIRVEKPEVAEAAKLIENTFRQVNIALVNELSEISNRYGFLLSDAVAAAATKPFGFMPFYPSIGAGGHCIPVDPSYLRHSAKLVGLDSKLIDIANTVNNSRPAKVVEMIENHFNFNFFGKTVQIVGIAYKSGISDVRESPALEFINVLRQKGANVIYHDPFVSHYQDLASEELRVDIDLGIIITPHHQIDFKKWTESNLDVLDLSVQSEFTLGTKIF
jgi:UDP-N-acetyl-D-glucosamine dehydrogenase